LRKCIKEYWDKGNYKSQNLLTLKLYVLQEIDCCPSIGDILFFQMVHWLLRRFSQELMVVPTGARQLINKGKQLVEQRR